MISCYQLVLQNSLERKMIQFSSDFLCSMRLWFTLLLCRHSYCHLRAIFQFVKSETLSGPIFHLVSQFGLVLLRNLFSSLLCSAKKDEAFIPWPYKFHYNMSLVSESFWLFFFFFYQLKSLLISVQCK